MSLDFGREDGGVPTAASPPEPHAELAAAAEEPGDRLWAALALGGPRSLATALQLHRDSPARASRPTNSAAACARRAWCGKKIEDNH